MVNRQIIYKSSRFILSLVVVFALLQGFPARTYAAGNDAVAAAQLAQRLFPKYANRFVFAYLKT